MPKKSIFFKKIFWGVGGICFLSIIAIGMMGVSSGWVSHFFSSAQADQISFSLHEREKKDLTLPDAQVTLSSFKKPVMLVLWIIGCGPCVEELVVLNKLAPEIRAHGGDVIPILLAPNWGGVVSFLSHMSKRQGGVYKGWHDMFPNLNAYYDSQGERGNGQVAQHFGIQKVPVVVFLDASGHEVERYEGFKDWNIPENLALLTKNLELKPEETGPEATADSLVLPSAPQRTERPLPAAGG